MKKKKLKTAVRKESALNASATRKTKTARPSNNVALKATILKGKPPQAQLRHVAWESVAVEPLNPLLGLHFVVGQNILFVGMAVFGNDTYFFQKYAGGR